MTTTGAAPVVATAGGADPAAPLVVLLHGRGSHERAIIALAEHLPVGPAYAAVRAPIAEGGGYAGFANRGIGRPVAESLRSTMDWFRQWLDQVALPGRPVVLIGCSGGAAFAGGLLLDDPGRYAGGAVLYGTLPFDDGVRPPPPGWPACPSSWRRASTTPSSRGSCSTAPGPTCSASRVRRRSPAATRSATASPPRPWPRWPGGCRSACRSSRTAAGPSRVRPRGRRCRAAPSRPGRVRARR